MIGFAKGHIVTLVDSFLERPETFAFMGFADTEPGLGPVSTQDGTRLGVRAAVEKLL